MWIALCADEVVARVAWWGNPGSTQSSLLDVFDLADPGRSSDLEVARDLLDAALEGVIGGRTSPSPPPYLRYVQPAWRERDCSRVETEASERGACLLLIEGEERRLTAWDFVHCPPWTEHIFVGAGDGLCLVLGVGARRKGRGIRYPVSELALRYGAGVETETSDPKEAYARFGDDKPVACPPEFPE